MWGFRKLFVNTDTQSLVELLHESMKESRELRQQLLETLKASQELNARQQESLDRVITSKFDVPVHGPVYPDIPPGVTRIPVENLSDALSIDDDREFLEAVHG